MPPEWRAGDSAGVRPADRSARSQDRLSEMLGDRSQAVRGAAVAALGALGEAAATYSYEAETAEKWGSGGGGKAK